MTMVLRNRRGDYGYDAPFTGLLPSGGGGLLLAAYHQRNRRAALARLELATSLAMLLTFGIFLHTTRWRKFAVWAELDSLKLRGDERVLDDSSDG